MSVMKWDPSSIWKAYESGNISIREALYRINEDLLESISRTSRIREQLGEDDLEVFIVAEEAKEKLRAEWDRFFDGPHDRAYWETWREGVEKTWMEAADREQKSREVHTRLWEIFMTRPEPEIAGKVRAIKKPSEMAIETASHEIYDLFTSNVITPAQAVLYCDYWIPKLEEQRQIEEFYGCDEDRDSPDYPDYPEALRILSLVRERAIIAEPGPSVAPVGAPASSISTSLEKTDDALSPIRWKGKSKTDCGRVFRIISSLIDCNAAEWERHFTGSNGESMKGVVADAAKTPSGRSSAIASLDKATKGMDPGD